MVAFLGLEPSVNLSGDFNGARNKISKRGSRFGRRVLFTVAMAAIRTTRNRRPINAVLHDYYQKKCVNKKKGYFSRCITSKIKRFFGLSFVFSIALFLPPL